MASQTKRDGTDAKQPHAKAKRAKAKRDSLLVTCDESEEEKAIRSANSLEGAFVQLISISDQGEVDGIHFLPAKSFTENELVFMLQTPLTYRLEYGESSALDRLIKKFDDSAAEKIEQWSYDFVNRKIFCTFTVSYADV